MMKKLLAMLLIALLIGGAAFAQGDGQESSPTTGLPANAVYQPMVVQIDNNSKARPQVNMIQADVIYEIEVGGGGYTRYTAVYNDEIPDIVESIRSTREISADICLDWDATLVHYGGINSKNEKIAPLLASMGIDSHFNGLVDSVNFYRDKKRVAPHNAVARLMDMYGAVKKVSSRDTPLVFSAEQPTIQGEDVSEFSIDYNAGIGYIASYVYNAQEGLYYRYYGGEAHIDGGTGDQFVCANVIVQYTQASWYNGNGNVPVIQATGTNRCDYFIGGKHFTGYWERKTLTDNTAYYDDAGNVVNLVPGKTFIQLLNQKKSVDIG